MGKNSVIHVEIDEGLKKAVDEYVKKRGMSIKGLVSVLLARTVRWKGE